jgi:ubiquinone biosynthesis protein COQ4
MISADLITKTLPPGRLDIAIPALQRLLRDPEDPEGALFYLRSLDGELHRALSRSLKEDPDGQRLLKERPRLDAASVQLDELARMPNGSLGRAYAQYFRERGLRPFAAKEPIADDADYIANRWRETHDVWHLVTGYGTYVTGELELQAFSYGNLGNPSSLLLLAATVPGVDRLRDFKDAPSWVANAYKRGRASRPLLNVIWEDHWERPLTKVREEYCAPR